VTPGIVIVYGAPASGKTRRARELLAHFGCTRLVDPWEGSPLKPGDLALTSMAPPFRVSGAKVVNIAEAKSAITQRGAR
jgi:hypothetical protein